MSAPQIPNLKTLRGPRGSRTLRRGQHASSEEYKSANDRVIQGTDQDASVSRLSAVEIGYLIDPIAKLFVPSQNDQQTRRYPIINRGRIGILAIGSQYSAQSLV